MTAELKIRSAARTDKGNVRALNEDSFLDMPAKRLWAVADGMGGHSGGDVASKMVIEALRGVAREDMPGRFVDGVEDAVAAVNERLCQMSEAQGEGSVIGSTLAVLLAFPSHCVVAWMGDSRIYRFRARDGALDQVTVDHSEVEDLVARGAITREQAKDHPSSNVVTRAVGGMRAVFLDLDVLEVVAGDRFLICSDGLYKELSDADVREHLAAGDADAACEALLRAALAKECRDNVTVVVVDFGAEAAPAPEPPAEVPAEAPAEAPAATAPP